MDNQRKEIEFILEKNKANFAEKIVEMQYKRQPDYWKKFGEEGRKLSIRDAGYHLPFLVEAIISDNYEIFTDYVEWVKVLFRGLNFPDTVMTQTLECTREVLEKELPGEMSAITTEFLNEGLKQMKIPVTDQSTYIDISTEMGRLAKDYTSALLDGDRKKASELIIKAAKDGVPIKDIYLEVFQKSQYEVGRLWLSNQISVAKEHFCTAATQMVMSQLYPYIFSNERAGRRFVGACVGGELHELGIRMVADFFEIDGWDTYYLGANAPASSIIKAVTDNKADVLGLSISMPFHRDLLRKTISSIRETKEADNTKILIGGVALKQNIDPSEYNADGWAPNALAATEQAKLLLS